jgi:NitT/TauT family transport system substrate-binding protein
LSGHQGRARSVRGLALAATVLAGAGAGSLAAATANASVAHKSLTTVSYETGYTFGAWDTGIFVARDKGYYKAAGLNVQISPGQGSASDAQLVATGKVDFANIAGANVAEADAKGAAIKMVASYIQENGSGIATVPTIKTLKEMEGHTFTGSAYDFTTLMFPAFENAAHLSGIPTVDVDPSTIPQVLETGKAQMMSAAGWAEVPEMKAAGIKFNYFSYNSVGVNTIGPGLTTSASLLKSDPAEVKAFVTATMKGWQWAYANSSAAATLIHKDVPSIPLDQATAILGVMANFAHTAASTGHSLGWLAPTDWSQTVKLLVQYKFIPSALPITQLFQNVLPSH